MRYIFKTGTGGYHLEKAHTNPPQTSAHARRRWGSLRNKRNILSHLLHEQYNICCYSEIRADQEGFGYHIEHVENKSQNPQRTFDYSNLAASALESEDLGRIKLRRVDAFGGHASGKQNSCNMTLFISPHRSDCPRFFAYLSDGRIVPAAGLSAHEQGQAQYTINILNLNCPYLVTLRSQWWEDLEKLFDEHITNGLDLLSLASIDLVPAGDKLSRFFSLTRQFFGPIGNRALTEHAPELL